MKCKGKTSTRHDSEPAQSSSHHQIIFLLKPLEGDFWGYYSSAARIWHCHWVSESWSSVDHNAKIFNGQVAQGGPWKCEELLGKHDSIHVHTGPL